MFKRKLPKRITMRAASDPLWEEWINDAGFTSIEDAYKALGLSRGSFYRQSAKPPTLHCRLAMAAIVHRQRPYGA